MSRTRTTPGRLGAPALALCAALAGCGGAAAYIEQPDAAFAQAVEASLEESWETALGASLAYLSTASEEDERYDRALMIAARAFEAKDLRYAAALYYLDVAEARRNVELMDEAIEGLARLTTSGPVDEDLVLAGYIAAADISEMRPEIDAFVLYHRGLDNLRKGERAWAQRAFRRIDDESPFRARAELALAADVLAEGELAPAREAIERLLEEEDALPRDVRIDARLAAARIAMDEERWGDAVSAYEALQDLAPERPGLLLEMAWAHYYRGAYRRSLGLLLALDAPVYGSLIAPERYLLEAYNLRRLCQLEPARTAAARLQARHAEELRDLRAGTLPIDSPRLRRAAARRPDVRALTELAVRTRQEAAEAERLARRWAEPGEKLVALYAATTTVVESQLRRRVDAEARNLARELIDADDGVRLILHELSVQLLRGRRRPPGPDPRLTIEGSVSPGEVRYTFQGEFWTDEIDDLEVVIPDRCLE
ncbi:MAG: hypothetical protein AAGH15_01805 [Myxococcota bacterium]